MTKNEEVAREILASGDVAMYGYYKLKGLTDGMNLETLPNDAIAAIVAILERELAGAKITFCPPAEEPGKAITTVSDGEPIIVHYDRERGEPHDQE